MRFSTEISPTCAPTYHRAFAARTAKAWFFSPALAAPNARCYAPRWLRGGFNVVATTTRLSERRTRLCFLGLGEGRALRVKARSVLLAESVAQLV